MTDGKFGVSLGNVGNVEASSEGVEPSPLPDGEGFWGGDVERALARKELTTELEKSYHKFWEGKSKAPKEVREKYMFPIDVPFRTAGKFAEIGSSLWEMATKAPQAIKEGLKNRAEGMMPKTGETKGEYQKRIINDFQGDFKAFSEKGGKLIRSVLADYGTMVTHPVRSFKADPVTTALDVLITANAAQSGWREVGRLAKPIKKTASKFFAATSGMPQRDVLKGLRNKRYMQPISKLEESKLYSDAAKKMTSGVDDITNFNVKTLEDSIANAPKYNKAFVDTNKVIGKIDDYVATKAKLEMTKLTELELDNINLLKKDLLKKGNYLSEKGNKIPFKDAHELKQTIYKTNKRAYSKPDWGDNVGNAYKKGAGEINRQLRAISPDDYAKANDKFQFMYDLSDEIGKKGFAKFEGLAAEGAIKSMWGKYGGQEMLQKINKALPPDKRFIRGLEELSIRKGWQEMKVIKSSLGAGVVGGLASFLAPPLAGPLAYGMAASMSPQLLSTNLRGLAGLTGRLGKMAKPISKPIGALAPLGGKSFGLAAGANVLGASQSINDIIYRNKNKAR